MNGISPYTHEKKMNDTRSQDKGLTSLEAGFYNFYVQFKKLRQTYAGMSCKSFMLAPEFYCLDYNDVLFVELPL